LKRIAWWIQLVEASPLQAHESLFSEFDDWYSHQLDESAKDISNWVWDSTTPDFIQLQGFGPPPDFQALVDAMQPWMLDGEYMVFAQMVDSVIKHDAITYYIVTREVVATMDGRMYIKQAIENIWELGIDRSKVAQ